MNPNPLSCTSRLIVPVVAMSSPVDAPQSAHTHNTGSARQPPEYLEALPLARACAGNPARASRQALRRRRDGVARFITRDRGGRSVWLCWAERRREDDD